MNVTIDLPDAVIPARFRTPEEVAVALRLGAAAFWYSGNEISCEDAARFSGISRLEFIEALVSEGVDSPGPEKPYCDVYVGLLLKLPGRNLLDPEIADEFLGALGKDCPYQTRLGGAVVAPDGLGYIWERPPYAVGIRLCELEADEAGVRGSDGARLSDDRRSFHIELERSLIRAAQWLSSLPTDAFGPIRRRGLNVRLLSSLTVFPFIRAFCHDLPAPLVKEAGRLGLNVETCINDV